MRGLTEVNIFVSILMLGIIAVVSSLKIHEEMTPHERATTFLTDNDEIPDYQIVPIRWPRIQKRDVRGYTGVTLQAFGRHIKLWLNPVEGVLAGDKMPIYNVESQVDGGVRINRYYEAMKYINVKLYEDLKNAATLAVNPGNGRRQDRPRITGVIGSENLIIQPVPLRLADKVARHQRSINGDHLSDDHHHHIVYKRGINNARPLHKSSQSVGMKPEIPEVVYPEILVLVDYGLYAKFRHSIWEIVPYLLGFWNGVDMKYRNLQNPRYRLNIAGIVLPLDSQAFPFVEKSIAFNQTLNGLAHLYGFGKWLRKHSDKIPLTSYDVAAFMTMHNFCSMDKDHECHDNIVGQAFPRGACDGDNDDNDDNVDEPVYKTMHIQDHGGFDGIYVAVHELGHSLGADHDGVKNSTCLHEHGLIMTGSPQYGLNSTTWSECSLSNFTSFIKTQPKCLYNVPNQGKKVPRYLPGKIFNADEQCKRIMGTKAYKTDEKICLDLSCVSPTDSTDHIYAGSPPADGTSCGKGKICLNGRCLYENRITW